MDTKNKLDRKREKEITVKKTKKKQKKQNKWRSTAVEARDRQGVDVWSVSGLLCGECNQRVGVVHHYSECEAGTETLRGKPDDGGACDSPTPLYRCPQVHLS